jgi:hypothetical protein
MNDGLDHLRPNPFADGWRPADTSGLPSEEARFAGMCSTFADSSHLCTEEDRRLMLIEEFHPPNDIFPNPSYKEIVGIKGEGGHAIITVPRHPI